jgi:hypothetical protein
MRWQLAQYGWPINGGQHYVPAGTIIDERLMWDAHNIPLPTPLPINARALDQGAYERMLQWGYPQDLVQFDPHAVRP